VLALPFLPLAWIELTWFPERVHRATQRVMPPGRMASLRAQAPSGRGAGELEFGRVDDGRFRVESGGGGAWSTVLHVPAGEPLRVAWTEAGVVVAEEVVTAVEGRHLDVVLVRR
jgi:hypothetical protein